MNFQQFEGECVGIALKEWPYPLIGIFVLNEDPQWACLKPIPSTNPLSKEYRFVDADLYFQITDLKIIKHIKYAETKENTTDGGFGEDRRTGKTAIG